MLFCTPIRYPLTKLVRKNSVCVSFCVGFFAASIQLPCEHFGCFFPVPRSDTWPIWTCCCGRQLVHPFGLWFTGFVLFCSGNHQYPWQLVRRCCSAWSKLSSQRSRHLIFSMLCDVWRPRLFLVLWLLPLVVWRRLVVVTPTFLIDLEECCYWFMFWEGHINPCPFFRRCLCLWFPLIRNTSISYYLFAEPKSLCFWLLGKNSRIGSLG